MSTTLDQKRGLIYTAFRDLLDEEQAERAVAFWDSWNDTSRSAFTPLRFTQAVQAELDLSTELKRKLIQYMVGYKMSDEHAQSFEETKPSAVTTKQSVSELAQPNMAPSIESEQYIVFTALLYPLLTRLRLSERQFLETLHPKARSDVKSLLEGSKPMMRNPERVMGNCLDRIYELLCDEFGPSRRTRSLLERLARLRGYPKPTSFRRENCFDQNF